MSRDDEYADWEPPVGPEKETDASEAESDTAETEGADESDLEPPPELREPLFRDRIRDRLGVSPQQWYVIETLLLLAPYPLFVLVYFTLPVEETLFLLVTLVYSLIAMYVGFLS